MAIILLNLVRSFLLLATLTISSAWAGPAADKLHGPVTDFIQSAEIDYLTLLGDSSKKIGYLRWRGTDAAVAPIVIVPGRGEVGYQWAETSYDLVQLGFKGDVYIWDPPGQGLSSRMLPDRPDVGHIENFSQYSTNLIEFLRRVRSLHGMAAQMIIAHSMGGAIAADALQQAPMLASRLTLITPMLDIRFGTPFLDKVITFLIGVLDKFPVIRMIAVNRGPPNPIAPAVARTSRGERLTWRQHLKDLYDAYLPGKTIHWVAEADRAIAKVLAGAEKLRMPILLFVGGADTVVEEGGDRAFAKACSANCTLIEIARGTHSLHEDGDRIRAQYVLKLAQVLGLPGSSNSGLCERLLLVKSGI